MTENQKENWYAAKIFYNHLPMVVKVLESNGIQWYAPTSIISSLIFFKTTITKARELKKENMSLFYLYMNAGRTEPAIIPDKEMEVFVFVTSSSDKGLEFLGDDKPEYHQGDRVRVIGGMFEGVEGHIKRIRKDRRLIVTLNGVAAVATSFIPPALLEKIPDSGSSPE